MQGASKLHVNLLDVRCWRRVPYIINIRTCTPRSPTNFSLRSAFFLAWASRICKQNLHSTYLGQVLVLRLFFVLILRTHLKISWHLCLRAGDSKTLGRKNVEIFGSVPESFLNSVAKLLSIPTNSFCNIETYRSCHLLESWCFHIGTFLVFGVNCY